MCPRTPEGRTSTLTPSTMVDVGWLLVVTGPPGAGKSAVAEVLSRNGAHSVLIEGDAFFGFLASGAIEPWQPESNDQNTIVTRAAASAAGAFASGGYATVSSVRGCSPPSLLRQASTSSTTSCSSRRSRSAFAALRCDGATGSAMKLRGGRCTPRSPPVSSLIGMCLAIHAVTSKRSRRSFSPLAKPATLPTRSVDPARPGPPVARTWLVLP